MLEVRAQRDHLFTEGPEDLLRRLSHVGNRLFERAGDLRGRLWLKDRSIGRVLQVVHDPIDRLVRERSQHPRIELRARGKLTVPSHSFDSCRTMRTMQETPPAWKLTLERPEAVALVELIGT